VVPRPGFVRHVHVRRRCVRAEQQGWNHSQVTCAQVGWARAELVQWGRPWCSYRTPFGCGVREAVPHKPHKNLSPSPSLNQVTSQLVRAVFQSIMLGSHEQGVFLAEPAAEDHPRGGGLGRPGEPVAGSPTHPVMPNLLMLWKMSPVGRGAGGCQGVPQGLFRALAPPFGTQAAPLPAGLAGAVRACRPRRLPAFPMPAIALVLYIAAKPLNQRSSLVTTYSQESAERSVET
jgi:hypothetical protein